MAQPEIDARNKYLAEMATKSAKDAADAKAIADNFAATAAKAIEDAKQAAAAKVINTVYHADGSYTEYYEDGSYFTFGLDRPTGLGPLPIDILQPDPSVKRVTTSGGINPALILAAAAAAFFIGG
jgi:hypothetical protein